MLNPTLLSFPVLAEGQPVPQRLPEEVELPLPPAAYLVTPGVPMWFVTVRSTGLFVYAGPGPVEIKESQAPF